MTSVELKLIVLLSCVMDTPAESTIVLSALIVLLACVISAFAVIVSDARAAVALMVSPAWVIFASTDNSSADADEVVLLPCVADASATTEIDASADAVLSA